MQWPSPQAAGQSLGATHWAGKCGICLGRAKTTATATCWNQENWGPVKGIVRTKEEMAKTHTIEVAKGYLNGP